VPPSAPANLVASVNKGKKVALSWNASASSTGVAGYYVYRNGSKIGSTTTTTYTDTLAGKSAKATYYVVAYDSSGNVSSPSNSVSVAP
jgi:chitodextrinase